MNKNRMFSILSLTAGLAGAAHAEQSSPQTEWNFDKDEVGKSPVGWRFAETGGSGKTGKWAVAADESAPSKPNVLKLETQAESQTYNLFIAEKSSFKDLDLRIRVKADSGQEDQGGGPIWRCQDENNYYICRINPLEGNFRVYKVENGKRTQLKGEKLETKTGQWYEVRAVMVGEKIECYVDGKKYLDAADGTFKAAGMIGLWTKADASSSFDNVAMYAPPSREKANEGDQ